MAYWLIKAILKPLLLALYRIRVEGRENIPTRGAAIIAANHLSFLDSFFIPLVIKWRAVIYLAKADYFRSWKTAWFFKMVHQIPTEREGGRKSEEALNVALRVIEHGKLLGIYPEGTRSPDGRLYRGRTGAARLALTSGVPVIPCGVIGTDAVMPKAAKRPRIRGRIEVTIRFGAPLDFARYKGKERDRLVLRAVTDEIMYEIMQLSNQTYVDEYASRAPTVPLPGPTRLVPEDEQTSAEALAG